MYVDFKCDDLAIEPHIEWFWPGNTYREAHPLGLSINWAKTKIQNLGDQEGANQLQYTTVGGNQVEVVESFTYLGSLIHVSGSSEVSQRSSGEST